MKYQYDHYRKVGEETLKSYSHKIESGFFDKYMSGESGLDLGYAGYIPNVVPVLPSAIGIDLDYPNYDGHTLPFPDNSQDYVYSSHFLEHVSEYKNMIQQMFRVTKKGGYLIIIVPHRDLYEKKTELPSRWNADHKRMYQTSTLIEEIEESLPINSYRIRHLQESDEGHNYDDPPETHGRWLYEIEVCIQKL